jgi:hypothetical protein
MPEIIKLAPEHKAERQRLATYHDIQPSKTSETLRSDCSQCGTNDIAWVTTEAYLSVLADAEAPQHVLDYPDGESWICLECEETGYIGNALEEDDSSYEQSEKEVRAFNDHMLLSKIPDDMLPATEKRVLDYFLTTVNVSGLHKEYDLFFELAENLTPREFELAGGAISREIKVNSENPVVLRNMISLALLAAPIVNAFAPEMSSTLQMPVTVKKLGKSLTELWLTDEFRLTDEQRANYARGLLMRRLCNPDVVIGHGYHEDLYTQWVGSNFEVLAEYADDVREHGSFDFDAMSRWLGKDEAKRFIIESEATEPTSLTSSIELGYVLESVEVKRGAGVGGYAVTDRAIDSSGKYVFTLAQIGFLEGYSALQGYKGRQHEMPAYKLAEALGLIGVAKGGDGLAEEVILAMTSVDQNELERLVAVVSGLSDLKKVKMIETLDELVTDIELQEISTSKIISALLEDGSLSAAV